MGPMNFIEDASEKANEKRTKKIDDKGAGRELAAGKTLENEEHPVAEGYPS